MDRAGSTVGGKQINVNDKREGTETAPDSVQRIIADLESIDRRLGEILAAQDALAADVGGKARTFDYQAGDVGYVPFAMGHYVENTGDETLRFLEIFRSPYFADVSLNQWMALTPPELVQAHLNLDEKAIGALRKDKPVLVG